MIFVPKISHQRSKSLALSSSYKEVAFLRSGDMLMYSRCSWEMVFSITFRSLLTGRSFLRALSSLVMAILKANSLWSISLLIFFCKMSNCCAIWFSAPSSPLVSICFATKTS